ILVAVDTNNTIEDSEMALLEGLCNLPEMDYYIGSVGNGMSLHELSVCIIVQSHDPTSPCRARAFDSIGRI
ncbi:hypothetical protein PAXRUDRAFT_154182, partial [Paxillus rubicundulus Ve08.2h10]